MMKEMLDKLPKFSSKNFYQGLIYENGLGVEKDRTKAYNYFLKGAVEDLDHSCAGKVLLFHIEPTKLN
jgi:TPR repeat protein